MNCIDVFFETVDKYYNEILPEYKGVTTAAMTAVKDRGIFKKRQDLAEHIDNFYVFRRKLEAITTDFGITKEQEKEFQLQEMFKESVEKFLALVDKSIRFYETQYKVDKMDTSVNMKDVSITYSFMQDGMMAAASVLEDFDRAYQIYKDPSKVKFYEEQDAKLEEAMKEAETKAKKHKGKKREKRETL